jgi:di/tripeptidase
MTTEISKTKQSNPERESMTNTFLGLVRTPSPSGNELKVAKYVMKHLSRIGVTPRNDLTARLNNSTVGNIIAPMGNGVPWLVFLAHMDTKEQGTEIILPIVKGDIISSDKTILGKAGAAALLEAASELSKETNITPTWFVFTTRAESDRAHGVEYLTLDKGIRFVFDVDGLDSPGKVSLYATASNNLLKLAQTAAENIGLNFSKTSWTTPQGSIMVGKGYDLIGLCRGGETHASKGESISITELVRTKQLIVELIRQAGAFL